MRSKQLLSHLLEQSVSILKFGLKSLTRRLLRKALGRVLVCSHWGIQEQLAIVLIHFLILNHVRPVGLTCQAMWFLRGRCVEEAFHVELS